MKSINNKNGKNKFVCTGVSNNNDAMEVADPKPGVSNDNDAMEVARPKPTYDELVQEINNLSVLLLHDKKTKETTGEEVSILLI